nr:hypothetical protein [Escherichia coli O25b:H4-ST131]
MGNLLLRNYGSGSIFRVLSALVRLTSTFDDRLHIVLLVLQCLCMPDSDYKSSGYLSSAREVSASGLLPFVESNQQ